MESGRARSRSSRSWKNSENGHHGTIVPHQSYTNDEGKTCRKYSQTIYIDGNPHKGYGTACRESDGAWQIVNN